MENIYQPISAKIVEIKALSLTARLFKLKLEKELEVKNDMAFIPGQFGLVGVWGYGEAPFGMASSPYENKEISFVVRKAGVVTEQLHQMKEGDEVTFRGPFGNGFPLEFFKDKDVVMITGGCGIPPIASLIEYIIKHRRNFNRVYLLYGAAFPSEILMKQEMKHWEKDIHVLITVDKPDGGWCGNVGLVSELVSKISIDSQNAVAAVCGPGPMVKAIENILRPLGISDKRIFVSEERKMQCGIGKCQHCTCGEKYVCVDGPVFNFDEIDKNFD